MKKTALLAVFMAVIGICFANNTFEVLARAGRRRSRERGNKRLDLCDARQQDMCTKSSKSLWTESKKVKGECAKKECLFNPTTGVTQHPQSMYYRFNPGAIKTSSRKIIYSFKEIKGEICAIKNQPCSCRNEERCTCESESARFCKQQYRIERNYFIVYNTEGTDATSMYYQAQQPQQQMYQYGSQPTTEGHQQQQAYQYGSQTTTGGHQQQQTYQYDSQDNTGGQQYPDLFNSHHYLQPATRTGEVEHVDDDNKKTKNNPKARSGEIGMGGFVPNYGMGGQPHYYNPMMHGQQNYYPNNQQTMYPSGGDGSQSDLMKLQSLAQNLQGYPQMGNYPPQNAQGYYQRQYNPYNQMPQAPQYPVPPVPGQSYGNPLPSPISGQQYFPAPPAPPAPIADNQEEGDPQERSLDGATNTESHDATYTNTQHQPAPAAQQHQGSYYYPQQQYQQGYQMPQGYMPQTHTMPQPQSHVMSPSMLRYFLFQSGSQSSNSFLNMLPYLMKNPQFSKVIRFESLYIMVPDGCKCQRGGPNQYNAANAQQRPSNNFWGQPQQQQQQQYNPFSNFQSFQQGNQGYSQDSSYPQFQNPLSNPYAQQRSFSMMGGGMGMRLYNYNPYAAMPTTPPSRSRNPKKKPTKKERERNNKKDDKKDDDKKSSS